MRTYEQTHPWLSFQVDLRRAGFRFWVLLGEAVSKCEHIAGVPLNPSTRQKLHLLYLAKGVAATTAIEGNTLTEEEVLQHLENKLKLPPSKEYLSQEVDNLTAACNQINQRLQQGNDALTPDIICEFNRQVLNKLTPQEDVIPGRVRHHSAVVGTYKGAPAEDCEYLLNHFCDWLSGSAFEPPQGMGMHYAVIKAIATHLYFVWIHPFGDGNGRTARLIEFQILLSGGVPTPAAHLLSNHYNQTRTEYYQKLELARKQENGAIFFLEYALQGFVDGLRQQLGVIKEQQWNITWENHVHNLFHDKNSSANTRRRWMALDLGRTPEIVQVRKLSELTPRLAKAYAGKTSKTLQRDLNILQKMELVERLGNGIRAKKEVIIAFLPWQKKALKKGKNP
jgi:Fic family protein